LDKRKLALFILLPICVGSVIGSAVFYYLAYFHEGRYRVYKMSSKDMEPTIIMGNYVLVDTVFSPDKIVAAPSPIGDIIAFNPSWANGELLFHRVIEKTTINNQILLTTKGDANLNQDPQTPISQVIGIAMDTNFQMTNLLSVSEKARSFLALVFCIAIALVSGIASFVLLLLGKKT